MVGSSNTKTESDWARPISLASFSRWASPPESPGVSSPRVRYPSPRLRSTSSLGATFFISLQKPRAVLTSSAISSGRDFSSPDLIPVLICQASFPYRDPLHSGQGISTSGRNCTSRLMEPVPSQTGQRRLPVL